VLTSQKTYPIIKLASASCDVKLVTWLALPEAVDEGREEDLPMKQLFARLWNEDEGAIIASEFLFVVTIIVIGIIVGLAAIRDAVNTELSELANALLALSQGYSISGQEGCCSATDGSEAIDTPGLVPDPLCTPPFIPSVIDVLPCN
jgi:Flp pilus assembly pilin Flp